MCAKDATPQPSIIPPDPNNFVVESRPPNVRFLSRAVQPPSNVYVEVSDVLVTGVATGLIRDTVTFNYRLLRFDGVIVHGQFIVNCTGGSGPSIHQEPLAEGFLLSVSCKAAQAITRGQTFVRVFINKPSLGAGQPSYMLMADYVTTAMAPAFPNGRTLTPVEGPGWIINNFISTPGTSSEWLISTPFNTRTRVLSGTVQFGTSAIAGNRSPQLLINTGGINAFLGCTETVVGPGTAIAITYSPTRNLPALTPGNIWVPINPEVILGGSGAITSNTLGLQIGDTYANVSIQVEQWLDNV